MRGENAGGGFFLSNRVFISCDLSRRRAASANDLALCAGLSFLTRHIYEYNIVVFIGRSFLGTSRSTILSSVK